MANIDLQKFILSAGEAKLINLDVSLGDVVKSNAFSMLQSYVDPWDYWCGNDFRFMVWPGPGPYREVSVINQQIASSLRETLNVAQDLNQSLGRMKR
jgi:hypothetical protein